MSTGQQSNPPDDMERPYAEPLPGQQYDMRNPQEYVPSQYSEQQQYSEPPPPYSEQQYSQQPPPYSEQQYSQQPPPYSEQQYSQPQQPPPQEYRNVIADWLGGPCKVIFPAGACNGGNVIWKLFGIYIMIGIFIAAIILFIVSIVLAYKFFRSLTGGDDSEKQTFTNVPLVNDINTNETGLMDEFKMSYDSYNPLCDITGAIYGSPDGSVQCDTRM